MPAPTFGAAGTYLNGASSGTANVPAPAGLVAGSSVVLVFLYKETTAAVTLGASAAGFTEVTPPPQITSGTGTQTLHLFWKVAGSSEPSTYQFTFGSTWRDAVAVRIDGANTTSPVDVFATGIKNPSTDRTGPSLNVTTTGADELLLWASANWNGGSWSGLTGFTANVNSGATGVFTKPQAVAGASGAVQGTTSSTTNNYMTSWLLALRPAQTVANVSGSDSGSGSDTAALEQQYSASDSATGSEAASYAIPFGSSDGGSASDTVSGLTANVTGPEQGTGAESLGINATVTAAPNTGTGSEAAKIGVRGTDSATKQDQLVSLVGNTFAANPGTGADGATVETLFGDLVISLWAVHPSTGALVALPDFTRLTLSPQRNSAGSITLDYPNTGLNFDLLRSTITGDRDLEVEIWSIGSTTRALRGYLQEASGDDVSEDGTWTFAGGFLELRMSEAVVWPQPLTGVSSLGPEVQVDYGSIPQAKWDQLRALGYTGRANDGAERLYVPQLVLNAVLAGQPVPVLSDPKRELKFNAVTPGELVSFILTQARARGALTDIEWDFTASKDSEGNTWPTVLSTKWSPGGKYDDILNKLVNLDLAEWSVEWTGSKRVLRMFVPEGRGTDLTVGTRPVVLRKGRNLLEAPRKWSVREAGTTVLAAGAEGVYQTASDADAQTRRGRRIERFASANNLTTDSAVQAFAQNQLKYTKQGLLEVTHGLGFLPGEPRPLIAFDVGDWVYSQTGTSMERLRVVQWTLTVDAKSNPSGTVTLNDTVMDALTRLKGKLEAIQSGDTVVGTSEESQQEDTGVPSAPEGVVVGSTAYLVDGVAHSLVTVGWNAVTTNTDGTAASDLQGYKVQFKYDAGGDWVGAEDVGANSNTSTFDASPGVQLKCRVAAYDRNGNVSAWSAEVSHTTEDDTTPPPVPSTPVVSNYLGVLKIAWDGNSAAGTEMKLAAPDFEWCEVHVSPGSNFTPDATTMVGQMYGVGEWVVADLPYGTTQFARLVAVDTRGNKSGPSAQGSDTPQQVVSQDVFDGAIGTAKLADAAITTAKINDLAVNDAKIGNLSVGKLTAGTFSASMTLSGIIRTALTGARTEIDSSGIRLYNTSGTKTVDFQSANGSALITGTYQSGLTNERINILPDGTFRIYPSTGTDYAQIANESGVVRMRSIADGSGRRSFVDYNPGGLTAWYGTTSQQRAKIDVNLTYAVLTAPVTGIRIWRQFTPADGTSPRFHFVNATASGDVGTSIVHYEQVSAASNHGVIFGATSDAGIVLDAGFVAAVHNNITPAAINAAAFNVVSAIATKTRIAPVRFEKVGSAAELAQKARAQSYYYRSDFEPRPEKPGVKLERYAEDGTRLPDEDAEWTAPQRKPVMRVGPMADDLLELAPQIVETDVPRGGLALNVGTVAGIAYAGVGELADDRDAMRAQIEALTERIAALEKGHPLVVEGEVT